MSKLRVIRVIGVSKLRRRAGSIHEHQAKFLHLKIAKLDTKKDDKKKKKKKKTPINENQRDSNKTKNRTLPKNTGELSDRDSRTYTRHGSRMRQRTERGATFITCHQNERKKRKRSRKEKYTWNCSQRLSDGVLVRIQVALTLQIGHSRAASGCSIEVRSGAQTVNQVSHPCDERR